MEIEEVLQAPTELSSLDITRRNFVQGAAAAGLLTMMGGTSGCAKGSERSVRVAVVGGGAAGMSMAARLHRLLKSAQITLIDPAERQYYQPGFTLIGGGVYQPQQVWQPQKKFIPKGVTWLQKAVVAIDPAHNKLFVEGGSALEYDFLVLTPGIQLAFEKIEGLTLKDLGRGNVHSIYDFEGAQKCWPAVQEFVAKGGRGIFTDTWTKHKCGGAPKKICLLTEHLARKQKRRDNLRLDFFTASSQLYDVPHFTPRLEEIYRERKVSITTNTRITGVDLSAKRVHMAQTKKIKVETRDPATGQMVTREQKGVESFSEDYDFLHLAPPQIAPDFVRNAGLGIAEGAQAEEGWVTVDKYTLVHTAYPNIVSLGDVSNQPTSKTSAAIRKQIPVAVRNLIDLIEGRAPSAKYDGYAACPIITDYGHVILAEFDYSKKPKISFPFSLLNMAREQRAAWWLKVYALKPLYYYGMLPGYW